jgi:response regulator RpfG family c-di-GMP phosphodiesterase
VRDNSGKLFDPACVEALFRDMAQVLLIEQTQMTPPPHWGP